jgi:hypothetical protein
VTLPCADTRRRTWIRIRSGALSTRSVHPSPTFTNVGVVLRYPRPVGRFLPAVEQIVAAETRKRVVAGFSVHPFVTRIGAGQRVVAGGALSRTLIRSAIWVSFMLEPVAEPKHVDAVLGIAQPVLQRDAVRRRSRRRLDRRPKE